MAKAIDSDIDDTLDSFSSAMSHFSDSFHSTLSRSDMEEKINKISDWVDEQKKEKPTDMKGHIENVGKVLTATTNAIAKFESGDPFKITSATLDVISSAAVMFGGPFGAAAAALCSIIGAIVSANKPGEPSVVERLAEVVHKELVNLNKKMQNQKYNGLKDRISDQKHQLQSMSREEKLDDPNLWNDYTQFLGELSERFESPLPFKHDENLSENPDVEDFVSALVLYCHAHSCFLTLLTAVKGRFEDLGARVEEKNKVQRKIEEQTKRTKEKLAFLSDKKYLTFLGRLPSSGGKLTKILSLSRNPRGMFRVEEIRRSLQLPKMPSNSVVESAVKKVLKQYVRLYFGDFPFPDSYRSSQLKAQFINNCGLPMKIVSGVVGNNKRNMTFVRDVPDSRSFECEPSGTFSIGGYIIIYNDDKTSSSTEPEGDVRVIELAMSKPNFGSSKVNIQDKTDSEFTKGWDTYNKMSSGGQKQIYWEQDEEHYIAVAQHDVNFRRTGFRIAGRAQTRPYFTWRFMVQSFDPVDSEDIGTT